MFFVFIMNDSFCCLAFFENCRDAWGSAVSVPAASTPSTVFTWAEEVADGSFITMHQSAAFSPKPGLTKCASSSEAPNVIPVPSARTVNLKSSLQKVGVLGVDAIAIKN